MRARKGRAWGAASIRTIRQVLARCTLPRRYGRIRAGLPACSGHFQEAARRSQPGHLAVIIYPALGTGLPAGHKRRPAIIENNRLCAYPPILESYFPKK